MRQHRLITKHESTSASPGLAHTRARRPGGRRDAVRGYGMYGVWYAIGVTETWCSQTSAGPWGIFKVKWL